MKLTELRELIREVIAEAWYDHKRGANRLEDDGSYAKDSEYVPVSTKKQLKKWYDKMQPKK